MAFAQNLYSLGFSFYDAVIMFGIDVTETFETPF